MSQWSEIVWSKRAEAPKLPGVYVIYDEPGNPNRVSYVGQSSNLFLRFRQHNCTFSSAARVKFKLAHHQGEWLMWEFRLIARIKPVRNNAGKSEIERTLAGRIRKAREIEGYWTINDQGLKVMTDKGRRVREKRKRVSLALRRAAWAQLRQVAIPKPS
jgi:hypothetical protein